MDYDNITDFDDILNNCTNNEDNFNIIIPTLLPTRSSGSSILCLMSLMV